MSLHELKAITRTLLSLGNTELQKKHFTDDDRNRIESYASDFVGDNRDLGRMERISLSVREPAPAY